MRNAVCTPPAARRRARPRSGAHARGAARLIFRLLLRRRDYFIIMVYIFTPILLFFSPFFFSPLFDYRYAIADFCFIISSSLRHFAYFRFSLSPFRHYFLSFTPLFHFHAIIFAFRCALPLRRVLCVLLARMARQDKYAAPALRICAPPPRARDYFRMIDAIIFAA
jgi:hypothetical protein